MNLLLAPLQGFTDATFRRVWQQHFSGIDRFYAPYLALQNDGSIKKSQWRDILPERNTVLPIPQILPSSAQEALTLMQQIDSIGLYREVNINMGCPYPMVTNKGRGSGLLPQPSTIKEILDALHQHYASSYSFSVKCRCGLHDNKEMEDVFAVLNQYALSSVILHPRLGKQLYKGRASWSCFAQAEGMTSLPLVYNGDINSLDDYQAFVAEFSAIDALMLGRGLLMNPLLAQEIQGGAVYTLDDKLGYLQDFVSDLIEENRQYLSGDSHLMSKMKSYLPYFESYNPEKRKVYKKLKKTKSMAIFSEEMRGYLSV